MNSYKLNTNRKIENYKQNFNKKMNNKIKSARNRKLRILDEIEAKDYLIHKNNSKIKKIKADSIKQLIYTNQPVPKKWKTKKNYSAQIYELFSRNPKFLHYIGSFNTYTDSKFSHEEKEKEKDNNSKKNENNKEILKDGRNLLSNKMRNKINKLSLTPIKEKPSYSKGIKLSITSPNKNIYNNKKPNTMKTKEIINILDELNIEYPIKEKLNELFPKEEIEKINNTQRNYHPIIPRRKMKQIFKDNIYVNLISAYKDKKIQKGKKLYDNKFEKNINLAKLKKEMIKNPLALKSLERINFYGPQYSYCSQCGIKNIDFYKKLSLKQLNSITNEIRKFRNLK